MAATYALNPVTPTPEAGSWYILDAFDGPPWEPEIEAGSWYILDAFYVTPRGGIYVDGAVHF